MSDYAGLLIVSALILISSDIAEVRGKHFTGGARGLVAGLIAVCAGVAWLLDMFR